MEETRRENTLGWLGMYRDDLCQIDKNNNLHRHACNFEESFTRHVLLTFSFSLSFFSVPLK